MSLRAQLDILTRAPGIGSEIVCLSCNHVVSICHDFCQIYFKSLSIQLNTIYLLRCAHGDGSLVGAIPIINPFYKEQGDTTF